MAADTISSIVARIASVRRMKEALCCVLDREIASWEIKRDREIARLKVKRNIKRNMLSPIYRLPEEILVHILVFVQGRHDAPSIFDTLKTFFGITCTAARQPAWRHALWTCSRFHSVALSHPELWAHVDTRWPQRWVNLCIKRAGEYPLTLNSHVTDKASAVLTTSWLRKSQDAIIHIDDYESAWAEATGALLEIPCPPLRWLTIKNSRNRKWTLTRNFLAGQCSSLLRLSIKEVHMEYIPDLPDLRSLRAVASTLPLRWGEARGLLNLRYLRLEMCMLPFHSGQGVPFLKSMPLLEEVEMLRLKDNPNIVANDLTAYTRVMLPHLIRLHITGPIKTVWLIVRVLPCPKKKLNMGVSSSSIDSHAALRLTEDILMYAKRFWNFVSGNRGLQLPAAFLQSRPMDSKGFSRIHIELADRRGVLSREAVFSVTMLSKPIAPWEAFLPLVTEASIDVDSSPLESIWPVLDGVTKLKKLNVWSREPRTLMVIMQLWANERAKQGRSPVTIEFCQVKNGK
jgi:hypothetical protein